ncbi:hypothetical protein LOK46_31880 (plasmid) [Methylobacterium sp. NMS14P]|uniref:hypothetical protein n=1 Tax=Methylobacterium sp. NMS14P TaxID=2894310 RepID=UPI00235A46A5|nr:hypothetical protein [Methylobacterium sp. NMS14P]WCS28518.1 hypothetical protein LOK46_31880 [Methylobacterium sp. NMS14P]
MQEFDEQLAREFVRGLVQSAVARGVDPAIRLDQFRALQQAVVALSRDPAVVRASEQLIRAIDCAHHELTAVKS